MSSEGSGSPAIEQVEGIAAGLRRCFGLRTLGNKRDPVDELVYVILSLRTPPDSYQAAYRGLRRVFRSWELLANTTVEQITGAITAGGLQRKKAGQLKEIASTLREGFGKVTLAPLRTMNDTDAERFLISLPGVGVKTARCVLMYSLDREVFPVDTHCLRVARRLGWVDDARPLDRQLADEIQEMIPRGVRKQLHVGMILLGRAICLPAEPACRECPILRFCRTGTARVAGQLQSGPDQVPQIVGRPTPSPSKLRRAAESSPGYRLGT